MRKLTQWVLFSAALLATPAFAEMKIRARDRGFNFPYLYDGDTESVSRAYGPVATPHVFVFDAGSGSVRNIGGQLYPALTYTRDKLARDVLCTGQSSNDLRAWLSEPPWVLEETMDLGPVERVRYRDANPLTASRFLRLALERP